MHVTDMVACTFLYFLLFYSSEYVITATWLPSTRFEIPYVFACHKGGRYKGKGSKGDVGGDTFCDSRKKENCPFVPGAVLSSQKKYSNSNLNTHSMTILIP